MARNEADELAQSNELASLAFNATAGAVRQLVERLEFDASYDKCGPLYYTLKKTLAEHDAKTYAEALAARKANTEAGERFEIMSKSRTHRGTRYPSQPTGMFAQIGTESGRKFIHLTGVYSKRPLDIKFYEGDEAEYDSYNLRYTGEIVKITEKCITIRPRYRSNDKVKRLDLNTFAWRNWNFDAEEVARQNHETSMYI